MEIMKEFFKAEQISAHVWWVGAIDWNVRNFHGYRTGRGTTYNAFLIVDEKITLIDTVKAPFVPEMLARISSVIDPERIDIIVSNHSEPDHSGGLPAAAAVIKPEKIYASTVGAKTLAAYYRELPEVTALGNGAVLDLGAGKITVLDTRMLHWPDSMVSYYDADKVLFSQDAFGMHLATSRIWADECEDYILDSEARKYFANILLLQSEKVLALLDALPGLNLDIAVTAPDHGPLWRDNGIARILKLYREAAEQKPRARALVAYATMWGSTRLLADALADGLRSSGIEVVVADLSVNDRSAIMTEAAASGIIAFGAPTMNNQMYPAAADVLTYMKGLKPKNKLAFAFGSCGWSGEGAKQIAGEFTAMKLEQPFEAAQVRYMPAGDDLKAFHERGAALGAELLKRIEQQ